MFEFNGLIRLADGTTNDNCIKIISEEKGDATAVFVDALPRVFSPVALDGEYGVQLDIKVKDEISGFMAVNRFCEFWCEPIFGKDFETVPSETQMLTFKKKDGKFVVVLPVVNDTYKCVFEGKSKDTFTARMFSWCNDLFSCRGLSFVYAEGENPSVLAELCVKTALEILNNGIRTREERRYPEILEKLGWCTWDSMQIRVSEDGIVEKCQEFKDKNIPINWAMIDDMWAEIRDFYGQEYDTKLDMIHLMHSSALYHFEADPIRFPEGLSGVIEKVKEFGIKAGMWLPTTGYWRGIDPDGKAFEILKDYLIQAENGYWLPDWKSENAYKYFKTFFKFFRECGAEFIKIDNQSMIMRYYKNLAPVGKTVREYHDGLEAAAGEEFDSAMINCMGTASEDVWSRTVSPVTRCSGDFKPENREWFAKHIMQCAYGSMFLGQFYWCDWDMWWTDDAQAEKNSLMRAVSGGPIYVSDMIGRSKKELLDPLCLSDGTILRCSRPGIPTADCVCENPTENGKALKIQNMADSHGIMAVVNINKDEKPVTATISGEQIDGFDADEYAVYEHYSKEVKILKKGESFDITLKDADDYKLYIFAPITDGFAAIGRTDKFISPKTIKYVHKGDVVLKEDGPCAYVKDGKLIIVE